MKGTKFQQDIQYLPLPVRLSLVPIALVSVYIIQAQTKAFLIFKNDAYQHWTMSAIYIAVGLLVLFLVAWDQIKIPLKFMYSCFFKPIGHHGNDQQSRLEAFYQDQATSNTIYSCNVKSRPNMSYLIVYDNSRGPLLRGRKTMLKLCAAQLKEQIASGLMTKRPIWIDLGGGTGKNK